jgi:hypothetical protein
VSSFDLVLLSPRWRGLMAARKMLDLLGGGCGLAVCWVYPLNPDAGEFRRVGKTRFDALPLSRRTPTLEDIVRPGS